MHAFDGRRCVQSLRLWHAEERGCLDDQKRPKAFAGPECGVAHRLGEAGSRRRAAPRLSEKIGQPFLDGVPVSLQSLDEQQAIPSYLINHPRALV
jgi:hypothetical protein